MKLILKAREDLIKKVITDKRGRRTTVWVKVNKKDKKGTYPEVDKPTKKENIKNITSDDIKDSLYDIHYHKNGKIKGGVLKNDLVINVVTFNKGTDLDLPVLISSSMRGVTFKKGTDLDFYDDGSLLGGFLSGNQIINHANFKSDTLAVFHRNGNIQFGWLHNDQVIDGIEFKGGRPILFHTNTNVDSGFLSVNQTVQGIDLKADAGEEDSESLIGYHKGPDVILYINGMLYSGFLDGDQTIQGKDFKDSAEIVLDDEGDINEKWYNENY